MMANLRRRVRRLGRSAISPHTWPAVKARWLGAVAGSEIASGLYALVRRSHVWEQQAMLAGMAAYHAAIADTRAGPVFELRRNVHRIEKGLVSRPQRSTFALDYIDETVSALERCASLTKPGQPDPLVDWATDVLTEYFGAVEPTPVVRLAQGRFASLRRSATGALVPRAKDDDEPPVEYEDLLALARRRRSVRRFDGTPVPREALDRAVRVAAESPSACNRQAFEFRFYDDPQLVSALVSIAPGYDPGDDPPPCMVVLVGKYRAYYRERDQHVIYIDTSLAAMALLLALESDGLSSCCINWPSLREVDSQMSALLSLDPDEEVVMLMAVGVPVADAISPYSQKATLDELRSYNRT